MSQNCRTHFKNLAAFVSIKKLNYFSNPLSSTAADTKEYWTTEMKNIEFATYIDLKRRESPQLIKEFFKYRITEEYFTFYNANLVLIPIYSFLLCQNSKRNFKNAWIPVVWFIFEDVVEICSY